MLEAELGGILRSLCTDGACYLTPADGEFSETLPPGGFGRPYYPPHRHWSHVEMIRLLRGELALHVNGVWMPLRDGKLRVFLPGTLHTEHFLRPEAGYEMMWLTIVSGGINIHRTGYAPERGYFRSREHLRITAPDAEDLWRCATGSSPELPRLHYLLMECLDHTLRHFDLGIDATNYRANVLEEIKSYLDGNYWKPLLLADLGAMTHLSPPYLNRLFRERYGLSLHDYLAKLRMERAAKLLRENLTLPVGKVAASAGIADQRYFSRVFRRVYGVTPGEYRAGKLD